MSKEKTSKKNSTALTVDKPKIELEGKTLSADYHNVLYGGNLRCWYDRREWKAKLATAGKGTIYGFTLQHQETGIVTPIFWFE
jgi:hypothetical protein